LPGGLLASLSPGTAALRERLLPAQPEVAGGGEMAAAGAGPLSLYPHGTRQQALQLLAVLAVFTLARAQVPAGPGLRRLAWAALANGALLALFALAQALAAPPGTIYGTRHQGAAFGPFYNRNHFPFYMNMCIGLGLGLLLGRVGGARRARGRKAHGEGRPASQGDPRPRPLLQNTAALWISFALGLMITSVVFSLSRGGLLSLVFAAVVCLGVKCWQSPRSLRLGAVLLPVLLALALGAWLGFDRVKARLATLTGDEMLRGDRAVLIPRCLPMIRAFPVLGTGYGAFPYVERLYRTDASDAGWVFLHAHNDYLEALAEGGVVRLGLSLVALGLVLGCAVRACRRHAGQPAGGLALGGLFAIAAVAAHSAVDFGLHIPAVALLATLVAALLCGLGDPARETAAPGATWPEDEAANYYCLRLWGVAPVAGAAGLILVALVLAGEGWRAAAADRLQLAAARLQDSNDIPAIERQIGYLEGAAQLVPSDARLQYQLGQAHAGVYEILTRRLKSREGTATGVGAILGLAPGASCAGVACDHWTATVPWLVATRAREARARQVEKELADPHRAAALRHYLLARDACPVMPKPHLGIAWYAAGLEAAGLEKADPRRAYLERAKSLSPGEPEIWFRCGALEYDTQAYDQAWKSWRRCLELADDRLASILAKARLLLSAEEIAANVLPDRPGVLLAAATRPDLGVHKAARRVFLRRALVCLETRPAPLEPAELRTKALVHKALGQMAQADIAAWPAEAVPHLVQKARDQMAQAEATYRQLLTEGHGEATDRCDFARFLYDQGRLAEARRELLIVLAQQPTHATARELLTVVTNDMVRGK
jgi:O-antigen ligase/tetratricopeptide (TPR) repeat protein